MKAVALVATWGLLAGGALAAVHGGGGGGVAAGHPVGGNHGPAGTFGHRPRGPYGAYGRGLGYGYGYGYGLGYGDYGLGYAGLFQDEPFYQEPVYNQGEYPGPGPVGPNVLMMYPPQAAQEMPVHPVIHEYGSAQESANPPKPGPAALSGETSPVVYLLAFRDKNIHAATTYWISGGSLHYLDTDHKERQVPLSSVDRELSEKLNRERNVPFSLP